MAENVNEHKVIFSADIADIKGKLQELQKAMQDAGLVSASVGNKMSSSMGASMAKIGSSLTSLGTTLSVSLTAPLLLLGKSALQTSAQMEQISVSFEVFTGSAETAKEMLGQLKDQAIKSPMQFQDITKGAQTLLGYGLTASQVIPITKMLGDVSGGNADKFQRLSLAFGQVNAAGRLMGQEARQMINAGFNPLQAISDKTGVSMAVLTKKMHDGQISVKDVGDAFIYATSEGGRFFGMADKQSQTLQGSFNKLQESAKFALGEIGTAINQELNVGSGLRAFAGFINELKDRFMQLTPEAKEMNLKLIAIGISIGPIILGIGQLISFVNKLSTSITLLSLSGGGITKILLTLAATFAATTVAGAMYDNVMESAIKKDPTLLKDVNNGLKEQIKNYDELIKKAPQVGFNPSGGQAEGTWVKGKRELIAERFKLYKQYTDNVYLIRDLEKNIKATDKLTGLSDKPSGLTGKTKAEKIEVIPGTDFQTKEYGNQLKKLRQISADAITEINNIGLQGNKKKLADLQDAFIKEKAEFVRYGQDTTDITRLYLLKAAQISNEIEAERNRALLSIIKPLPTNSNIEQWVKNFASDIGKFNYYINEFVVNDNESKIRNYTSALTSSLQDFGVNIFSGFANIAGSALAGITTFGDAISQVGSMFLSLIGDLLIQMGTSAIKLGISAESIKAVLSAIGLPGAGFAAIAAGTLAVAAGSLLKGMATKTDSAISVKSGGASTSVKNGTVSQMASGSNYAYGGASYSNQSIRMMVDLTGSITATPTGYSINKSFETTLRVTGR
jgi:tape measure domain-containing protein